MGKINVGLYDKIMMQNQAKRENTKIKANFFYINLHLKDCLQMEFTVSRSELKPETSLTSFTS